MERLENIAQTYSQTPWRKQLRYIGLFFLALVVAALIAAVYLNVSARAAAVGREIQSMQADIEIYDREIEDSQSHLAMISSADEMEVRAAALGFVPVDPEQVMYLKIPGYVDRQPAILAPHSSRTAVGAPVVPAEYTESLFSWMRRRAKLVTLALAEVKP